MLPKSSWSVLLIAAVACLPALVTCSDEGNGSDSTGGKTGGSSGTSAGSGGAAGSGAASSGGSGASAGGSGGAATSGGSAGSGGAGGSGTSGSGGSSGSGGAGGSGGAASDAGPPPPTEAGLSVYSVECSGDSKPCGYPSAQCLAVSIGDGSVGYTCSNECQSNADCSSAPSGAEAQASCVQFTQRSRCVLQCNNAGTLRDCPSGMNCYTFPGSPTGYCLWM
jgi:hypothetical protein